MMVFKEMQNYTLNYLIIIFKSSRCAVQIKPCTNKKPLVVAPVKTQRESPGQLHSLGLAIQAHFP